MRTLLLGVAAAALPLADASACGGFFCSQIPIDQSAERIVFGVDPETNTIDTHVQIAYSGSAEQFAWVVPVPAVPELFLSTEELFRQLPFRTQPQFWLQYREEGTCAYNWELYPPEAGAGGFEDDADADTDVDSDGGGVVVVAEQQVGPYETVTLQAESASDLLDWLVAHDYDLPASLDPVLQPYVMGGAYFVALRLANDQDVGDIAPLGMRYVAEKPMIPIQLTSIAATPDMRLEVYVLGAERAVPDNYLHVRINEAAVDWLGGGSNYTDVITQAANEAGGHAFATDFSGPAAAFTDLMNADGLDPASLAAYSQPWDFVDAMIARGYPPNDAVRGLLREFIPMPQALVDDGVDESAFYNCLSCFQAQLAGQPFDAAGLAAALDARVVTPMAAAEAMIERSAQLTRLTSSISPVEMTVDPTFVFNADMGDVSNLHQAGLVYECGDGGDWSEAPRRLELADGRVIEVPPESWFWENGTTPAEFMADLGGVAAEVVEQTGASGEPTVVDDRGDEVDALIATNNLRVDDLFPQLFDHASGCGCDGSGAGASGAAGLVALAAMARRRRRG